MKATVLKSGILYSSSRYLLLALSIVRNLMVAKILGPQEYGSWVIVILILTFGDQIHLGLRHVGDQRIPFLRGRGEGGEAKEVANNLFGGISIVSLVVLVGLTAAAFTISGERELLRMGIMGSGLIIFCEQINRFFLMLLRTRKEFVRSTKVETITEVLRTFLVVAAAYVFRFPGALVATIVVSAGIMTYFFVRYRQEVRPNFSFARIKTLSVFGILLFGVSAIYILLLQMDRVVGSFALTDEELGIYGIAAVIAQLPLSFTQAVSSVYYPTLSEIFGKTGERKKIFHSFSEVMYGAALLSPPIVVTIFYGSAALLRAFLPAYRDSVSVLAVLLPGVFFVSFLPILSGVHTSSGNARNFLVAEIISLIGSGLVFGSVMIFFSGIMAISLGMTTSMMLYAGIAIMKTYRSFSLPSGTALKEIAKVYIPSVASILIVFGLSPAVEGIVLQYLLYLVIYVPLLLLGYRLIWFPPRVQDSGAYHG